jgi:lipopolysaccharide transport system ATP-binding protein
MIAIPDTEKKIGPQIIRDEHEVVVSVENVSKKFCKSLKRSMAYGIIDLSKDLLGRKQDTGRLRKDEFWALEDISFELRRGETLGLIGPNGSGKTTLLRLLAGIFPPDKGEIKIKGRIGALIAVGAGFHPHMTGRENIFLNGAILGMDHHEIKSKFDQIVDFAEIGDFLDAPVSTYSSGMRVRLGFSIATAIQPDVLLVDEILAVGDMGFRAKCYDVIGRLSRRSAIIFVTHSMPIVGRICNRAILMNNGIELVSGSPGVVIEGYLSQFPIKADPTSNLMPNETLRILTVEIKKLDGTLCNNRISYGEGLKIEILLKSTQNLKNLVGRLSILTTELMPIAITDSSVAGFSVDIKEGLNKVSIMIPKLLLGPSKYMLGITVTPGNCFESILWVPAMNELIIDGPFVPNAPYYVEANWKVLNTVNQPYA